MSVAASEHVEATRRKAPDADPTGVITPAVTVPVEQLDAAARAHLPAAAFALLAAARTRVPAARLTWALGWGRQKIVVGVEEDGTPLRAFRPCPVESLVLRVPGVLWVGWERRQPWQDARTGRLVPGDERWSTVKGQLIDASAPGGVRLVTQTEAGRILK